MNAEMQYGEKRRESDKEKKDDVGMKEAKISLDDDERISHM